MLRIRPTPRGPTAARPRRAKRPTRRRVFQDVFGRGDDGPLLDAAGRVLLLHVKLHTKRCLPNDLRGAAARTENGAPSRNLCGRGCRGRRCAARPCPPVAPPTHDQSATARGKQTVTAPNLGERRKPAPSPQASHLERQVAHRGPHVHGRPLGRRRRQVGLQLPDRLGRDPVVRGEARGVEQRLQRGAGAGPVAAPGSGTREQG